MIILLVRDDAAAAREASFARIAEAIHGRVPNNHAADLAEPREIVKRGICGDCDLRVVPTRQGLCPRCGGYLHDAENVEKMRQMALRLRSADLPARIRSSRL